MDVSSLKEYIVDNNCIYELLDKLGCHHIKNNCKYYQCGNPDGDNQNAVMVYKDYSLMVINYTRDLGDKKNFDIFDLISFYLKINFFESLKWVCETIGIDYYSEAQTNLPSSLIITKMLLDMQKEIQEEYFDDKPLKPIPEDILKYYYNFCNGFFYKDNIDYDTQKEFEIGYDDFSNRITIPIRDEIGNLVGVKGRLFKKDIEKDDLKYLYIEPCNRAKILYGLYKTYDYIKKSGKVYICESEKGVMQLWSYGIRNSVATGGKKVSRSQIEKITRLCVDVIFVFDKDVTLNEIKNIAEKFIEQVNIYAVIDNDGILEEKESPTDNYEKFKVLTEKYLNIIK